jgi:hypothetical protein
MQLYYVWRTPVFYRITARMGLFYDHEAVHSGRARRVIVFTAGRCGVDGQGKPGSIGLVASGPTAVSDIIQHCLAQIDVLCYSE